MSSLSVAIATPSYSGDFERCRLLCASIDRFVSGHAVHYLLVEDRDLELFAPLAGPRRQVIPESALLARLEREHPDLLLVAFGNPRQERWIAEKLNARHCSVAAGIGAFFDFLAGEVTRAPLWIRRLRMEWLYRLWLEPGRLWRRYVVGNPIFLLRVLRQRLTGRKVA